MTNAPTLKIGVTLNAITVQSPTFLVEQTLSEIKKKQTRAGGEDRAPKTHAEFGRAE